MTPKQSYSLYIADDTLSPLSTNLLEEITKYSPVHVLDFGMGSGKHIDILNKLGICTIGIDISMMNVVRAHAKYDLPFIACGDETYLRNLCNADVVFTCSVLDHIENIDGIIGEFKRIANKAVILAETNDMPGEFYYPHDYKSYGFKELDFTWVSGGDLATYHIYKWDRSNFVDKGPSDDLG
jgi:ubiquinone/menaquinone biosynthesis C-methylase UbiE